jgi:hypothetical protein
MRGGVHIVALVAGHVALLAGADELRVGFDASAYSVKAGEAIPIRVEFTSTAPVALFSYGFRLLYDPASGVALNSADITVPAALDFNGPEGANAVVEMAAGVAGVKGTVNFFGDPIQYYGDSLLSTFQFRPLSVGEYDLRLELFRTLGQTEDVFVSADGAKLDAQISFGQAKLSVIPEPGTSHLFLIGSALFGWACFGKYPSTRRESPE